MSARHKLNAAAIHGVLLVAGVCAAIGGSWTLFVTLAIVLLITAMHTGDIRISNSRRK